MRIFDGGCTPRMQVSVDYDPNPNGLPVLWLGIRDGRKIAEAPLNKSAVSELIIELQRRVSEM